MTTSTTVHRIGKVLALLDSDHAGEVQAAARALRRLLTKDLAAPDGGAGSDRPDELEACLAYAAEAIAQLTRDIELLRRDNARLRARAARRPAAVGVVARHPLTAWGRAWRQAAG
ncbi:MAG: hypothetical protein HY060_16885 [Proteobacteria bacterium]|nr:hypothetical protein [Pseudomonadota bacterium]